MKILQLCIRVPDPPGDGGAIAMKSIAESLIEAGASIKVLALNTKKHFVDPVNISEKYKADTAIETVYLDASVKIVPAFVNLFFSKASFHIQRFDSKNFREKLTAILTNGGFDIVQLESLYLAPYLDQIRKCSDAKIVLRAHNVEYVIWERLLGSTGNMFKRYYLSVLTRRLKAFEISMLNRYDAILPITRSDEKIIHRDGCKLPIHVTPLGLNTEKYQIEEKENGMFSVFHLGSMDWMPNIEALNWFIAGVLPELRKRDPSLRIYLAGKKMPGHIKKLASSDLIIEDTISDAIAYMSDKPVMVVPLLSGGGMRVKIIEGMAMGKTIISTRIGAEGIDCEHLKNILIADTPADFIHWIITCKNDPSLCKRIGAGARELALLRYDNKIIGKKLFDFYKNELLL